MFFIVEDLLTGTSLERAAMLAQHARFVDGKATAQLDKTTKNNSEMEVSDSYLALAAILDNAIDSSRVLTFRLLPRFRAMPIINRYDTGMYYAEHTDAPIQGGMTQAGRSPARFGQNFIRTDYSMTLFLSDPRSYDGGELELRVTDEPQRVKLRAGSAVCYSTGIPHSVRAVTRGTRLAAIYWFQSLIRDIQIRRVLWDQFTLQEKLAQSGQRELAEQAASVRNNLVRYLAEI